MNVLKFLEQGLSHNKYSKPLHYLANYYSPYHTLKRRQTVPPALVCGLVWFGCLSNRMLFDGGCHCLESDPFLPLMWCSRGEGESSIEHPSLQQTPPRAYVLSDAVARFEPGKSREGFLQSHAMACQPCGYLPYIFAFSWRKWGSFC